MTTSIAQQNDLIRTVHRPDAVDDLVENVRSAYETATALYPRGGATSLDYGLPITRAGDAIDLTGLNHVIDYPAADMTVTVRAGIRMGELDRVLAAQQQMLPLDAPSPELATLGGVLATNFSGPRRLGYGTARDYVIGIRAVDGRGSEFVGGGRVVKNVAGYDLCKLLIGSLGTLAITTEVTLKLKPRPPIVRALVAAPRDHDQLHRLLGHLVQSPVRPTAAEWLAGLDWHELAQAQGWPSAGERTGWLWLLLEGIEEEVDWMQRTMQAQWRESFDLGGMLLDPQLTQVGLRALTEFPASSAGLTLKANVRPSSTIAMARRVMDDHPEVSIEAHAASGLVNMRWRDLPASGLIQSLVSTWQPAAIAMGGNLVMLRSPAGVELTRRAVWGTPSGPVDLMRRIKDAFDPRNILNPDRFVY
jgi:glycolate oxidase FAD binding subunit